MAFRFRCARRLLPTLLLLIGSLLPLAPARAQGGWMGLSPSNYGGTNNLFLNPSTIADSPYHLYVNVAAADAHFYNNYLKVDLPYSLWKLTRNKVGDQYRDGSGHVLFREDYIHEEINGRSKFVTVSAEARFPAIMLPLAHGQTVAFSSRVRAAFQLNNVSEDLARLSRHGLYEAGGLGLANIPLVDTRFSLNVNSWQEFDFSYARILTPNTTHFFKAGATLKYLVGLGGGYINNQGLGYLVYSGDSIQLRDRHVEYGYTDYNFYDHAHGYRTRHLYDSKRLGRGLGLDLGVTYEWRPDAEKYEYVMDNARHVADDVPKYKLRLGLAIVDLGRIKYNNERFVRSSRLAQSTTLQIGSLDTLTYEDLPSMDQLVNRLVGIESTAKSYKSRLPHTLNITADYHVRGPWYVAGLWNQSLLSRYAVGIRTFSGLAVIPRYEKQKIEFSLPISLADDYHRRQVGAMIRVGPAFLGSDNLGGVLGIGSLSGYDLYAGATFALFNKRPADRDHDGVSDKLDSCPDVPGVWEFHGCPDRDGDHVQDAVDDCPDDPGLLAFHGCPDRDQDSIIDKLDTCPDVAGIQEFNGCPDRDSDHVQDSEDRCPDVAGAKDHSGCPDTDGDGVFDPEDECVTVAGAPENRGCPWADEDRDGVVDKDDACPHTPGPPSNRGCPALTPVEVQILKTAFDNLEFEFRKAVIRPSSYPALVELANVLNAKPTYRLKLAGHTDNVGKPQFNLTLSRQRATAVKDFLVLQGVDAGRFVVEAYGPNKPVASNKTEEGRARNRRVEMTILFE